MGFLDVAILQMFCLKKKALRKSEGLCVRLNRLPEVAHAYAYADICTAVEVGLRFPNQFAVIPAAKLSDMAIRLSAAVCVAA